MNDAIAGPVPAWFRILSILGLLWTLFGVVMYLMHVGVIPSRELNEAERALEASAPVWVIAAFAVAVFAGALGTLGLVLLRRWAKPLLVLSLVAVLLQEGWTLFVSNAREVLGASAVAMPLLIILAAILLVWLANAGIRRGWLT